jgi:hypothetical protein
MSTHQVFSSLAFSDKLIVITITLLVIAMTAGSILGAVLLVAYCCWALPALVRYLGLTAAAPAWDLPCREVK